MQDDTQMEKQNYTPDGKHPDDAIYETKMFINELTNVQESYLNNLAKDLNLNEEGIDWLFDYIHNSGDEGNHITFEEYISYYNKQYKQLLNK